ncbi:MAG: Ger(x)C family spore germination protein [Bacilli bacterium]|jgi:spore germination protein KC|nr:Ger(x)C family spore germination protein [Bacilli bacterium]MCX4254959.1 Ger(x)C family spore germination protein [Bacilli bacterium]
MKKILILLIIPLLLGGCYDYNELNDLAIVAGVGIDYEDDKYIVTFEILSTKKEGEQSASSSTYNVSAKGDTVTEAFANNGNNLDKVAYFDHIEVVVISEEVAKNHLKQVCEYLIRGSKIRNEFFLTLTTENTAKDIITSSSKEKPIASTFIVDLLEYNDDSRSAGYYVPFTKTLRNILTGGEDAMMSTFKLKDDKIVLDGMAIFKDYELMHVFKPEEASIINFLNNFNTKTVFFEKSCGKDKKTVISLYESKVDIAPNNDNVVISGKLNARVNEDNCDYNLKDDDSYKILQKDFNKIIEEKVNEVIDQLKAYESNVLSIGKNYYNKYRKKYYYRWTDQDFKYDFDLKINKKGLVFTVK